MSFLNPINCNVNSSLENSPTVVDLFSGAGGFSLAALNCGFNVLSAIEYDKTACSTYRKNIIDRFSPGTQLINEDILTINPKIFRAELNLQKYELDLLLGGPPCQGFSSHRINGQGIADPRNTLLLRYFDFVRELGPKIFLVENVPGLLWARHNDYLNKFKNLAKRHGYRVFEPVKLNAKDYGVPQNRERVFLLGISTKFLAKGYKRKFVWPPKKTHFAPTLGQPEWENASTVFPKPPAEVIDFLSSRLGKSLVDRLSYNTDLDGSGNADPCNIYMQHTQELVSRFEQTPVNGGRHDLEFRLPCHSADYDGHKDVYGRIKLAQPGPTITTGCINPSKGRFLHPWLPHGISPRIAARLQTFPDDFEFAGGITSQAKQIGNAVPVRLGTMLLTSIKAYIQVEQQGRHTNS
jgi:DNA (cytosine-5)-methyltransferase 1